MMKLDHANSLADAVKTATEQLNEVIRLAMDAGCYVEVGILETQNIGHKHPRPVISAQVKVSPNEIEV